MIKYIKQTPSKAEGRINHHLEAVDLKVVVQTSASPPFHRIHHRGILIFVTDGDVKERVQKSYDGRVLCSAPAERAILKAARLIDAERVDAPQGGLHAAYNTISDAATQAIRETARGEAAAIVKRALDAHMAMSNGEAWPADFAAKEAKSVATRWFKLTFSDEEVAGLVAAWCSTLSVEQRKMIAA